jgi:hypothetical protein
MQARQNRDKTAAPRHVRVSSAAKLMIGLRLVRARKGQERELIAAYLLQLQETP